MDAEESRTWVTEYGTYMMCHRGGQHVQGYLIVAAAFTVAGIIAASAAPVQRTETTRTGPNGKTLTLLLTESIPLASGTAESLTRGG